MAGKSSKGSERLLSLRGNVWWYRQQVPKAVHETIGGSKFLLVNLHTPDVAEAKNRRNELEALTKVQFQQIRAFKRTALSIPGWSREATQTSLSPAERGALARTAIEHADDIGDDALGLSPLDLAVIAAEQEADGLKPAQRKSFEDAKAGRVNITHYLDAYLATAGLAPKTTNERRGLIGRFESWCVERGIKLDGVNRRLAGRYVSEMIDPMHPETQRKHLTAFRAYWKYMGRRGHVRVPPSLEPSH